ncbi:hypothetical protein AAKU67_002218 [Oxalobacteraceae bacterium GrIS 2.11]
MAQPLVPPLSNTGDMTPINVVVPITPGTALPQGTTRGFMVNVAGNVNITDAQGNQNVIAVLAATMYWIRLTAVAAASTTATGIFAFY